MRNWTAIRPYGMHRFTVHLHLRCGAVSGVCFTFFVSLPNIFVLLFCVFSCFLIYHSTFHTHTKIILIQIFIFNGACYSTIGDVMGDTTMPAACLGCLEAMPSDVCTECVCVPFRLGSNNAILINIIEYYSFIFLFFIFSFIMMNVNTRAIFDFSVRTFEVMFVRSIRSLDTRARSSQHTEHRAKLNNIFDEECNVIDVIRWLRWSLIECTQHTAHT